MLKIAQRHQIDLSHSDLARWHIDFPTQVFVDDRVMKFSDTFMPDRITLKCVCLEWLGQNLNPDDYYVYSVGMGKTEYYFRTHEHATMFYLSLA